jgi:hypothetical protein
MGNGIGIEFFEFVDPPMSQPETLNYTRRGGFHVAVTDPDPHALYAKVLAAGGKQIGLVSEFVILDCGTPLPVAPPSNAPTLFSAPVRLPFLRLPFADPRIVAGQ